MSTDNNGWDKIADQENRSTKKKNAKSKLETAVDVADKVSWIIYVVAAAIVGIVALTVISILR